MTSPIPHVGGVILIGGRSSRMGTPKHLLPVGAEIMLHRIVRILGEVVSPIVVVASSQQEIPPLGENTILVRDEEDHLGPLAGMAAGLSALQPHAEVAYVSSCDVPLLKPEFVRFLLNQLGEHELLMPSEEITEEGKTKTFSHPLAGVYRTSLGPIIREMVQSGQRRPVALLDQCDAGTISVQELKSVDPQLHSLLNVNTPEDYQRVQQLIEEESAAMTENRVTKPQLPDVRMKGFQQRSEVGDALKWVDEHSSPLPLESVPLTITHRRILAADVHAEIDVPSFDRSAMDGYALRGEETEGAGDYNPLTFRVLGRSAPGKPFAGQVEPGTCVRILTGAPIPEGANAVLPVEYATETAGMVEITTTVPPLKHMGRIGEDVSRGTLLFKQGRRLRPQDVGLLASVGLAAAPVIRRPQVRLVITGEELVPAGQERGPYQIYDSNSHILFGLLTRDGGMLESIVHTPDDRQSIRDALTRPGADVILVSGGSSVGEEDHAPNILREEGSLDIHGIAMRPSSPAGMGRIDDTLIFLLPGNPVSCLCAYDFFAGRTIRRLGALPADWPYAQVTLPLRKKISSVVGRVDYCRVQIVGDHLEPLSLSGASILSSTTRADGFVIIPGESEGYAVGASVTVYLYEGYSLNFHQ